jgi:hypothetical protein
MAQQSPLSKSLSVQNSPLNPLTLANGFNATPGTTPNTFAIDPDFRIGYAQNWQASAQMDLPAAMVDDGDLHRHQRARARCRCFCRTRIRRAR